MKVDLEDLTPVEKMLSIEVPWDTIKDELEMAYKGLQKRAKLKGFRAGKVPRKVLEQYYKRTVEGEVIQRVIDESFRKAIVEKELVPINNPVVDGFDDLTLTPDEPFCYQAKVEVKPEVEVGDYKGIEIKKQVREVSDAEVEKELEQLRQKAVVVETVSDREDVQKGDLALIDFFGFVGGETFKGGKGINYTVEVGGGQMIEGFEDQLIGMKVGEQKTFNLKFPKDDGPEVARGKDVEWKVDLKEIKKKILPDLDDEFAKDLGEYESLEELRGSIRENLKTREDAKGKRQLRESVLEKLVELNSVDVPNVMIQRQLDFLLQDVSQLAQQNKDPKILEAIAKLREENQGRAKTQVAGMLILDAIAKKENIEVSDAELDGRLSEIARDNRMNVKQVRAQLERDGRLDSVRYDMIQDRALEVVLEAAKVSDEIVKDEE